MHNTHIIHFTHIIIHTTHIIHTTQGRSQLSLSGEAIEASGVIPSLNNYYPDRYKLVNGVHVVVLHDLQIKPLMRLYACTISHCTYKCIELENTQCHSFYNQIG